MTQQQWQSAFGGPGASFDARVEQTLKRLEEENKMKQYSVRAALIALALILAMTGVVYAVSTHWMIGDYVGGRGAGNLPQDFDSGYEESFSLELGGVRFRIRDAYVNGNTLMAVTEVSRADGKPAIFMGPGTNEEDPIDDFDQILSWELRDGRSIRQYANTYHLPVYDVDVWFSQPGKMNEGSGDFWAEDEFRLGVFFSQVEGIESENGFAELDWMLYLGDEAGERTQQNVRVKLPVEASTDWEVPLGLPVEGLPLTLDKLYLRQSRIDLQADIQYTVYPDQLTEEQKQTLSEEFVEGFSLYGNVSFALFDPTTDEKLPEGSRVSGSTDWLNEERTVCLRQVDSVYAGFQGDTLRIKVYDPWKDQYVGSIDVKIR